MVFNAVFNCGHTIISGYWRICCMRLVWLLAVVLVLAGCMDGSVVGEATSPGGSEVVSSELDYVQQMIALERASAAASEIVAAASSHDGLVAFARRVSDEADADATILEYWLGAYYEGASVPEPVVSARSLRLESGERLDARYEELFARWEREKRLLSKAVLRLSPREHVQLYAQEAIAASDARVDALKQLNE